MNSRVTLFIVLIAVALGSYFLLIEMDVLNRKDANKGTELAGIDEYDSDDTGQLLFDRNLFPDDIRSITIARLDQIPVVIEHSDDPVAPWHQAAPVSFALQTALIDQLINTILSLRFTGKINPSHDIIALDSLGLNKPAVVITINASSLQNTGASLANTQTDGSDNMQHTLKIGRIAPGGRAYIQLNNAATVYVVSDQLNRMLSERSIRDYRVKSLPLIPSGQVQVITLVRPDETLRLARRDSQWVMTQPEIGRADRHAAMRLINTISMCPIHQFVVDQPADISFYGLDRPTAFITLNSTSPATSTSDDSDTPSLPLLHSADDFNILTTNTLRIGNISSMDSENRTWFAAWNDLDMVFTVSENTVRTLLTTAMHFHDKRLTDLNRADLAEVAVEYADGSRVGIIRERGTWVFAEPTPGYDTDSAVVDELLDALFVTPAFGSVPLSSVDSKLEQCKVYLTTITRNDQRILQLFVDSDKCYTAFQNETIANVVHVQDIAPLLQGNTYLRDRTVLDLSLADIVSVKITRLGKHPATYLTHTEISSDQQPDQYPPTAFDPSRMSRLINQLIPLRARRWSDSVIDTEPNVKLSITTTTGITHDLVLYSQSNRMSVSGDDMTFEVDGTLADFLRSELRNTTVLDIDTDQIASVNGTSVTGTSATETKWTITRDVNGRFVFSSDTSTVDIDESIAGALFDTLSGLQVCYWIGSDNITNDTSTNTITHTTNIPTNQPTVALTINTTDNNIRILKLWSSADSDCGDPVGRFDNDEFFTILPSVYARLTLSATNGSEK